MENFKREFEFIDAENHRAKIEAEITERNGYKEFTVSGSIAGHGGQCQDVINPRTENQKKFIELWNQYHLNGCEENLPDNFDKTVNDLIDAIEKEEKERQAEKPEQTEDEKLAEEMEANGIDEDMIDACRAYLDNIGGLDLSNFEEAYNGQFSSDEEFAEDMAENIGAINKDVQWPNNCIDWEQAARYLMQDYFEVDGYYFRNL
jgi:hypothetical protein